MRAEITRFQTSLYSFHFFVWIFFCLEFVRTYARLSNVSESSSYNWRLWGMAGNGRLVYHRANKIKSEPAYIIRKYVPQRLECINRFRDSVCLCVYLSVYSFAVTSPIARFHFIWNHCLCAKKSNQIK